MKHLPRALHVRRYLRARGVQGGDHVFWGRNSILEVFPGGKVHLGANVVVGQGVQIRVFDGGELIVGDNVLINNYAHIECVGRVVLERDTLVNVGVILLARGQITVGADVLIAPYTLIVDHDHAMADPDVPIRLQGYTDPLPVTIGSDVWIGNKVSITKGVTIGPGAVIGANAVVTRDIPGRAIAIGSPAKVVRFRT